MGKSLCVLLDVLVSATVPFYCHSFKPSLVGAQRYQLLVCWCLCCCPSLIRGILLLTVSHFNLPLFILCKYETYTIIQVAVREIGSIVTRTLA